MKEETHEYTDTIIPIPLWAVILIAALCWPAAALADEVFRGKDQQDVETVLRITDKPCASKEVLAFLHERLLDDRRFKASVLTWKGQDWPSCYAEKDETVFSIDSEGSPFQPVPRSMFRDESI
jgi:hypothetical protein